MSHWEYFSSQNQNKIKEFVNKHKPKKGGLVAMLSHGKDFHIWARKDNFPKKWELKYTGSWQGRASINEFGTMINGGKVVPVGFNMSNPPNIWYFEHE